MLNWLVNILDVPQSSWLAQLYRLFMIIVICISVVATSYVTVPGQGDSTVSNVYIKGSTIVFVIDFCIRLLASFRMSVFVRKWLTLNDFFSFLPYLIFWDPTSFDMASPAAIIFIIQPFIRIMKLVRFFPEFRLLITAITKSAEALGAPLFLMAYLVSMFGFILFFCEQANDPIRDGTSMFTVIPDAMWFSVVTLATVGYGDMVPLGSPGRIMNSLQILISVIYIAVPLAIVGTNFQQVWDDRAKILLIEKTRENLASLGLRDEDARDAFKMFDINGDGRIDLPDFIAMTRKFQVDITEEKAIEVFNSIDEDGLGFMSYKNFARNFFPHQNWTTDQLRSQKSMMRSERSVSKSSSGGPSINENIKLLTESMLSPMLSQVEVGLRSYN